MEVPSLQKEILSQVLWEIFQRIAWSAGNFWWSFGTKSHLDGHKSLGWLRRCSRLLNSTSTKICVLFKKVKWLGFWNFQNDHVVKELQNPSHFTQLKMTLFVVVIYKKPTCLEFGFSNSRVSLRSEHLYCTAGGL